MSCSRNITKKNVIFLFAYGLYILSMTLEYTSLQYSFNKGLQIMRYGAYALLLLKILLESYYRKKSLVIFGILLAGTLMQSFVSGLREIFFLLLILYAIYDVYIEDAVRIQVYVQMIVLLMVFALCIIGVFENGEFFDHGRIRYTMGFDYINGAGSVFLSSEMGWLFIRDKKLTLWEVLGILAGWYVIYYFTDFRTMAFVGAAAVLLCYLVKNWKIRIDKFPFKAVYLAIPVLMTAFTWVLQLYYNGHAVTKSMQKANAIFNGRLNLAKSAIDQYGLHLFGERVRWVGNTANLSRNHYNFVDCSYIKIAIDYGIFIAVLILILYCYMFYRLVRENHHTGCILLSLFMVCAFMLPVMTGVYYNPLLLLAGGIFYGKTKIHQS